MAELKGQQQEALDRVLAFLGDRDATAFSLQGGAGVGKTFVVGHLIRALLKGGYRVGAAAPTHKACRVLRSKLDAAGVPWVFKPKHDVPAGVAVVDTTAALLGIMPVVDEDQGEDDRSFKRVGDGSLGKLFEGDDFAGLPAVLVVDEASMVGRDDYLALVESMRSFRAKLVFVGDEGQLPPVQKQAIDFARDFDGGSFTMSTVLRQAAGSNIVRLAWAVRGEEGDPWAALEETALLGGDVVSHGSTGELVQAYLSSLEAPVDDEARRSVFVAYRNAVVDAVQESACQRLYGHGRRDFRAGQLVLAATAAYAEVRGTWVGRDGVARPSKFTKLEQLCAVADQLRVVAIGDAADADPVYGRPVVLDRVDLPAGAPNRRFSSWYVSGEELADQEHPFCVRSRELLQAAKDLQAKVKAGEAKYEEARRTAWGEFFKHKQRVCSFAHPFAITSHKSQGSTYRAVYVHAADLLRHNRKALYVAVTRPREQLHV